MDKKVKELAQCDVDCLLAINVEKEVDREGKEVTEEELRVYDTNLKTKHPILYLSKAWRKHKMETKKESLEAAAESTHLERVANRLKSKGHEMQSAIRKLAVQFRNEVRGPLAKKIQSRMSSFPPATFEVLQLNPNHWTLQANGAPNRYKTMRVNLSERLWHFPYSWMMAVTWTKHFIGGAFQFLITGPLLL